jgi:hypothetical protein
MLAFSIVVTIKLAAKLRKRTFLAAGGQIASSWPGALAF